MTYVECSNPVGILITRLTHVYDELMQGYNTNTLKHHYSEELGSANQLDASKLSHPVQVKCDIRAGSKVINTTTTFN